MSQSKHSGVQVIQLFRYGDVQVHFVSKLYRQGYIQVHLLPKLYRQGNVQVHLLPKLLKGHTERQKVWAHLPTVT